MEQEIIEKVTALVESINENPFDLGQHDALIGLLRLNKKQNISAIHESRKHKLEYFVASPREITEWLEDLQVIEEIELKNRAIVEFYTMVILDFPTVYYWLKYLEFASEILDQDSLKEMFTSALNDVAHDFKDCHKVWNFVLGYFSSELENGVDEDGFQTVLKFHFKRISYPHSELEQSLQELSTFISKYDPLNYEKHMIAASKISNRTKRNLRHYEQFELEIANNPTNSLSWTHYLQSIAKYGDKSDFSSVSTVFYRSIQLSPGNPEWVQLWLTYIYIIYDRPGDDTVNSILQATLSKFVRMYPNLTTSYAEFIRNCLSFNNGYDYFDLMMQRLNNLDLMHKVKYDEWKIAALAIMTFRYRLVSKDGLVEAVSELYTDISKYVDFAVSSNNDIFHSVEKLAVSIFEELDDFEQAEVVIDQLMQAFGEQTEIWLFAYNFYKSQKKSIQFITKMFEKAVSSASNLDWPELIFEEWLQFEQIHGDIDSYKKALLISNKEMSKIVSSRIADQATLLAQEPQEHDDESPTHKKRKTQISLEEVKRSREDFCVKVSNLPDNTDKEQLSKYFEECGTINNISLFVKGGKQFATIEFTNEQEVFTAMTKSLKKFGETTIAVNRSLQCTIFVTNYPPSTSQQDIREMFSEVGTIVNIRFPLQKSDRVRRFCYIEYADPELASKAIFKYNGKILKDSITDKESALKVAISEPRQSGSRETPISERKARVTNLPFNLGEEEIKNAFLNCGKIFQVVLPRTSRKRDSTKKNDGIAIIVFETVEGLNKAIDLGKMELENRSVEIAKHHREHTQGDFNELATVGVKDLDDTVSSDQIKAFFSENIGPVSKVELYPPHNAALIEFSKVADAGRASITLTTEKLGQKNITICSKSDIMNLINGNDKTIHQPPKKLMVPSALRKRRR